MRCDSSRVSRRRIPGGLLGMVVLVVLAEYAIRRHDSAYLDPGSWDFRYTARAVGSKTSDRDLLCFGDSLIKLSTIPPVLESRVGLKTYNLAISGSQTPLSYFLLRRALNSGCQPKAVILECSPALLRLGPEHNLQNWSHALNLFEAADLAWVAGDADLFARIALGYVLPSVQDRFGIRKAVSLVLAGQANNKRFETRVFRRNWEACDGAQIMQVKLALRHIPRDLDQLQQEYYPAWISHPVNNVFLRRFLDLAADREIPVYWVIPPILPALQAACERAGFTVEQSRFLHALIERYPNVIVVDGRRQDYDPAVFLDPNHLDRDGAYTFSIELAQILRQSIAQSPTDRPRWVHLPPFVPRRADDEFQDLRQMLAEKTEESARR